MQQILQNLGTGETDLVDVPAPPETPGRVLIRTTRSLVSLGTERMLVQFGQANLLQKARQQPEKVRQVLDKVRADGLLPTLDAVFKRLDDPLPLGYCNVGVVIADGGGSWLAEVEGGRTNGSRDARRRTGRFRPGDRVVSNGPHAEIVSVPENLIARILDNVSDEEATFAVVGSIALQGIRLLNPTLGETVVVVGLGLIGQIGAQLLRANGCRVIGIDFDQAKLNIAASQGITTINPATGADPVQVVQSLTRGIGADGVLITASSKAEEVMSQCARMSRKRGRIVLVGVVPLNLSRADFYEKELSFQVSCSYGPGRYDPDYEQRGIDYPLPFVRWTEQRNFEAVLGAISSGAIDVKPLITEVVDLADYQKIYGKIGESGSIASILRYPDAADAPQSHRQVVAVSQSQFDGGKGVIAVVGAGNFAKMTLLPALKKAGAQLKYIVSSAGVSGTSLAKKYGIAASTTNCEEVVLPDAEVNAVVITTRHNLHGPMAIAALEAGKHVFVEKPLCLTREEMAALEESLAREMTRKGQGDGDERRSNPTLTVGFNRRFSPLAQKMKTLLGQAPSPINVVATMNAGFIPPNVWVHDLAVGGGRIVGEACHFIDFITFLTGSLVSEVCMSALGTNPPVNTDTASILLKYENGSLGVVNYFSNGSKAYSKERVEVYSDNRTLVLDNFRRLDGYGFKGFSKMKSGLDKGHTEQFRLWNERLRTGGAPLIAAAEIFNTTKASFAALESLQTGEWVKV